MNERLSGYTLLNHLTGDVSVWLRSASLDMICQLSCQMMAQVHMSVQISLVNFHVHHLSCNTSAQLHSRAQMTTCELCLADQHLGCNQSGLAAMCEDFGSAQNTDCQLGCDPQNLNSAASTSTVAHDQLLCTMSALVQSVSRANAMSAQLQCFSSNRVHQLTASG